MLLEEYDETNIQERHTRTAQLPTSTLSMSEKTFRKC